MNVYSSLVSKSTSLTYLSYMNFNVNFKCFPLAVTLNLNFIKVKLKIRLRLTHPGTQSEPTDYQICFTATRILYLQQLTYIKLLIKTCNSHLNYLAVIMTALYDVSGDLKQHH